MGCMSKDLFTGIDKNRIQFAVLNLEDSTKGNGTHWVCLINIPAQKYCYYFDSFGFPPPDNVTQVIKRDLNKNILYNALQIQNIDSSLCGYYCLYLIDSIMDGQEYLKFNLQFDPVPGDLNWKNEDIVANYFSI